MITFIHVRGQFRNSYTKILFPITLTVPLVGHRTSIYHQNITVEIGVYECNYCEIVLAIFFHGSLHAIVSASQNKGQISHEPNCLLSPWCQQPPRLYQSG